MEKNLELFEDSSSLAIQPEDHQVDGGWQTVTYSRRKNRRHRPLRILPTNENYYQVEQHRPVDASAENSINGSAVADVEVMENASRDDVEMEKKEKKLKVIIAEAARNINVTHFAAFIADVTEVYKAMHDLQLMRFADYFGYVFAKVSPSQFPWIKILKESSVVKMVDIPLANIPKEIYNISVDWLNNRAFDALGSFVLWLLDDIIGELELHEGVSKATKKVAIFVVLAMILRRKPDVLISLLPIIKDNEKYEGHDKIPVMVWVITQASQGDLAVGLFMCVHFLFNVLNNETSPDLQSQDLALQVVEKIISSPKARNILVNGAVRKGERLVPPSALDFLMRATFSAPSIQFNITERFHVVYPILKEIAIAVAPGSKAMKQITQKIMLFAIIAAGEGSLDLSQEASDLCIWCLTMNHDCYKQWDDIYLENLEGSVVVLKKLLDEWKAFSVKQPTLEPLKESIKKFRVKNEKAMSSGDNAARQASLKVAEKYCKMLLGQLSPSHKYMKSFVLASVVVGIGAVFALKDMKSLDSKPSWWI